MRLLDLLVYVDAHPTLQRWINIICVTATGLLTVAPLMRRRGVTASLRKSWLFIAVLALSIFACRFPGLLVPTSLNSDEAQMLAQAITFETHPIPWRDIDGNTGGPIDSYALLWCIPLGIQPTYLTGRILGLLCILGTFIFLYLAGRHVAGDIAVRLALMPAFLFICWNANPEFVHYSSEVISVFLIGWAVYLITKWARSPASPASTIQLGLMLGLLPFAKLQSVLLGGFLGLTAIWVLFTAHRQRGITLYPILILVTSALAPAVIILSIVAGAGALTDFWQSYIDMARAYCVSYPSFSDELVGRANLISWVLDPTAGTAVLTYLAVVSTTVLGFQVLLGNQKISRSARNWFVWSILFLLATAATVTFSGKMFPHYQLFFLPAATFLLAVNFRLIRVGWHGPVVANAAAPLLLATILTTPCITAWVVSESWDTPRLWTLIWFAVWFGCLSLGLTLGWWIGQTLLIRLKPSLSVVTRWQKFMPLACLIPFFIIPSLILSSKGNGFRGRVKMFLEYPLSPMDEAILRDRPPGGRIAIWGWASEFAAETHTPLGTRDAIAAMSMYSSPFQDYYRQRYLRDLQANRPELFLEATGPHNMSLDNHPELHTLDTFPELAKLISEQYRLDQQIDGMRLFIRRDLIIPR